jgi:hypothetical protein
VALTGLAALALFPVLKKFESRQDRPQMGLLR